MVKFKYMKTLLVGNFGAKNIGDELILSSALEIYPKSLVMTSDEKYSQTFTGKSFKAFLFPPTGLKSFFKFILVSKYRKNILGLKNEDVKKVVFAGGGLFAIKFRACLLWFLVFIWLKKLCKDSEFIFEYQGVDDNLSFLSKKMIQYVFSRADFISVRDVLSKKSLEGLGIKNVILAEDRVFGFFKEEKNKLKKIKKEKDKKNKKILLLNSLSYFEQKKYSKIKINYKDYKQIFLAFAPSDLSFLPENFEGEVLVIKTKKQLLTLMGESDSGVGERLHFLILCKSFLSSEKTKTLKTPYSEKVQSFCDKEKIKVF